MGYYSIDDEDGNEITTGLDECAAHGVAKRIANERGSTVYLYSSDDEDNESEAIDPDPILWTLRWTTWGSVRGLGPVRNTQARAERDLAADHHACTRQGGYSDRDLYVIDAEGYVRHPTTNEHVWPHGRTSRALKIK